MEIGICKTHSVIVTQEKTALAMGSGGLNVFATPAMVALMENTAYALAQEHLPEGQTTVGTSLQIEHTSATPVGLQVSCTATLLAVEGRKLTFSVEATDPAGPIGHGTHERFVVDAGRFLARANKKCE